MVRTELLKYVRHLKEHLMVRWPEGVAHGDEEPSNPISIKKFRPIENGWSYFYQTRAAFESWEKDGWTKEYGSAMVGVCAKDGTVLEMSGDIPK